MEGYSSRAHLPWVWGVTCGVVAECHGRAHLLHMERHAHTVLNPCVLLTADAASTAAAAMTVQPQVRHSTFMHSHLQLLQRSQS